jgi:predicted DNA-binding protein
MMVRMATQRRRTRQAKGRARETGKTHVFMFELEPELDAALNAAAERERRTKRAILTIALERYLKESG